MTRQRLSWDADAGARLKAIRERVGLTQKGLADKVHKSASYVSELERGDHPPSPECLELLESALGLEDGLADELAMTEPAAVEPKGTRAVRERKAVSDAMAKRREQPEDEAEAQARERRQRTYEENREKADHCTDCGLRVAHGSQQIRYPYHLPGDNGLHLHHRGVDGPPYVEVLCCACYPKCHRHKAAKAWREKQPS